MMALVLENDVHFSEDIYRTACQKAVDIEDLVKVQLLLAAADHDVPELSPSFPGDIACYAEMDEHRFIAAEIINQCSEEQIATATPILLELFAEDKDFRSLSTLIEKGFSGSSNAWNALYILTGDGRGSRIAINLLKSGCGYLWMIIEYSTPVSKTARQRWASCCWTVAWISISTSNGRRHNPASDMGERSRFWRITDR